MSADQTADALRRIQLAGDVLIPDDEFCDEVLAGATRRTAQRLDSQGLPFVMVAGHKYRPLNQGRDWLAGRIVSKQPPRTLRRGRPAKP